MDSRLQFYALSQAQNISDDFSLELMYKNVDFPNGSIDDGWFNDYRVTVDCLIFHTCNLRHIGEHAFDAAKFRRLRQIEISRLKRLEWKFGLLDHLTVIYLERTHLVVTENFLSSLRQVIQSFNYKEFPSTISLGKLLGTQRFKTLSRLCLHGIRSDVRRSLHSDNFTTLSSIRTLLLTQMGIERIDPSTFDYIGETLVHLDLSRNKLKFMHARWFAVFFDIYLEYDKYIMYYMNQFVCNCEFYMTNNLTIYLKKEGMVNTANVLTPCETPIWHLRCPHLQELTKEKLYLNESELDVFSYPRVDVRLQGRTLLAYTEFKAQFRILAVKNVRSVEKRKRSKCPSPEWIRDSVECMLLLGDDKHFNAAAILYESNLTMFYPILVNPSKRVWPMHVQTVNSMEEETNDEYDEHLIIICVMMTLSIVACVVGLLIICGWQTCRTVTIERSDAITGIDAIAFDQHRCVITMINCIFFF